MASHFSGNRLYNSLSRHLWWESIYRDALNFSKNCPQCVVTSGNERVQRPPLHPIPVQWVFQILGLDVMELPVMACGNRYVIVFQDFLSKWPLVFPTPDQTQGCRFLIDTLLQPTGDGAMKVLLANCLGLSQRVEEGTEVGTVSLAELVDSTGEASVMLPMGEPPSWDQDAVLQQETCHSQLKVRRVMSEKSPAWRKRKLQALLTKEFEDSPLSCPEQTALISLLEEYHDVFSLEDGERGGTDLVQFHINTGLSACWLRKQSPSLVSLRLCSQIDGLTCCQVSCMMFVTYWELKNLTLWPVIPNVMA